MHNLPIIMLTGEDWDPVNVGFGNGRSREQAELRMIRSLEIGVTKRKLAAMKQREMDSRVEQWGQVKRELSKLSSTLHEKTFCKCLIGSVNVVTAYLDDVDKAMEKHKASVLTLDRHSKVGPEELSRKWNIGLARNGEGYFGRDDAAWGLNSSTSNVEMVKSRSLTLTQAKVERDVVFGYFNCKGKVVAW
jgi:hypothetical protein